MSDMYSIVIKKNTLLVLINFAVVSTLKHLAERVPNESPLIPPPQHDNRPQRQSCSTSEKRDRSGNAKRSLLAMLAMVFLKHQS
jgi:hypothetical protein